MATGKQMWYVPILNIAKWIFAQLPIQTILARALAWSIKKVATPEDVEKLKQTIVHCNESIGLFTIALAEKENSLSGIVTKDKLPTITEILDAWGQMKSAKELVATVATTEPTPAQ